MAAVDEFDLLVPIKRTETSVSNSGTNAICLPYDVPVSRNVVSELETEINGQLLDGDDDDDAVTKIMKFDRAADNFDKDAFIYESGESPPDDFALVSGEGYRIVVNDHIDDPGNNNDFQYRLNGDYSSKEITLYAQGDTLPGSEGTSNTGQNHYCAPFDGSTRSAVEFMNTLNDIGCPGGSCVSDVCSGGDRDGEDCTPFVSISRFLTASDALETYTGSGNGPNFPLKSGEAYLVQVSGTAVFTPATFTSGAVTVEIIERRPSSSCAGPIDGGGAQVNHQGVGYEVRVDWDHANNNNLVFEPKKPANNTSLHICTRQNEDAAFCCDGAGSEWKGGTCTPPGSIDDPNDPNDPDDDDECQDNDHDGIPAVDGDVITEITECGCEIRGPLSSLDSQRNCNNVGCDDETCDNDPDDCDKPDKVFCNTLHTGYTFAVSSLSFDGGSTWLDNATEVGVVLATSADFTNCCEARCSVGGALCTEESECTSGTCQLVLPAGCE